jgi:hypothetical protein
MCKMCLSLLCILEIVVLGRDYYSQMDYSQLTKIHAVECGGNGLGEGNA